MRPVAVDVVVIHDNQLLLVYRKFDPEAGKWALPGGFVDEDETTTRAATREVHEETGIVIKEKDLELVGVYSDPERDPRQTVSVVYAVDYATGRLRDSVETHAAWFPVLETPRLAFDHMRIYQDALGFFGE